MPIEKKTAKKSCKCEKTVDPIEAADTKIVELSSTEEAEEDADLDEMHDESEMCKKDLSKSLVKVRKDEVDAQHECAMYINEAFRNFRRVAHSLIPHCKSLQDRRYCLDLMNRLEDDYDNCDDLEHRRVLLTKLQGIVKEIKWISEKPSSKARNPKVPELYDEDCDPKDFLSKLRGQPRQSGHFPSTAEPKDFLTQLRTQPRTSDDFTTTYQDTFRYPHSYDSDSYPPTLQEIQKQQQKLLEQQQLQLQLQQQQQRLQRQQQLQQLQMQQQQLQQQMQQQLPQQQPQHQCFRQHWPCPHAHHQAHIQAQRSMQFMVSGQPMMHICPQHQQQHQSQMPVLCTPIGVPTQPCYSTHPIGDAPAGSCPYHASNWQTDEPAQPRLASGCDDTYVVLTTSIYRPMKDMMHGSNLQPLKYVASNDNMAKA